MHESSPPSGSALGSSSKAPAQPHDGAGVAEATGAAAPADPPGLSSALSATGAAGAGAVAEVDRAELLRLASRFCWNDGDAEDAVQRALLILTERAATDCPENPVAWTRAVVARQAIELNRRRQRQRRLAVRVADRRAQLASERQAAPPDAALRHEELADAMRNFVARLPERQQIAVVLRHMEGRSYDEIARTMDVTESTARVLVHGGREALRAMLASERPELAESEPGR